MKRKTVTYAAEKAQGAPHVIAAAVGDTGRVEAYVSVFGNVDLQGDRIISTAFDRSLAKWRASGDPIPVVWSHAWGDPAMHIGTADPYKAIADVRGLLLVMQFDLADEDARKVFK
ncbi:MAG: HK97 family phage prohead protease, partial [Gammaproteobacteria bacterium]